MDTTVLYSMYNREPEPNVWYTLKREETEEEEEESSEEEDLDVD